MTEVKYVIILLPDGAGDSSCGHCGRIYNPYLGNHFWSGMGYEWTPPAECESHGDVQEVLCDDCHRKLVREADRR